MGGALLVSIVFDDGVELPCRLCPPGEWSPEGLQQLIFEHGFPRSIRIEPWSPPPVVWLTLNEAAIYLRVSRATIYRFCERGRLRWHELTSEGRRFRREDLDGLLQERLKRD